MDAWDDAHRELSPGSPLKFNYRRVVGGLRLLLTEASPYRLLFQDRIGELKADLVAETGAWDGIEVRPHRFGGTEFLVEGREIGHIHEWGLVDIPFVGPLGAAVRDAGLATRHHILPNSGWATTFVETPADRDRVRDLYRLSYLWHLAKYEATEMSRAECLDAVRALDMPDSVKDTFERTLNERTPDTPPET